MDIRIKYPDPYGYEEQTKFDGLSNDLSNIKGKNDEQDKVNIRQDAEIANLDKTNKEQDAEIENKNITVEQNGNLIIFYQGNKQVASINQNSTVDGGGLSDEITRAKSAETSIDTAVGLTKAADGESRTYTNTGTYIGKGVTNTIKSDISALDTQVKANTDAIASANAKNTLTSANNALGINAQSSGTTLTINVDKSTGLEIDDKNGIKISNIDGGTY